MSQRVEFRFLQVVLSDVADERLSVLLLHWDGGTLRVARGIRKMPRLPCSVGKLRRDAKAIGREAYKACRRVTDEARMEGLPKIFPVREGHSSSCFPYWSPIVSLEAKDSKKHFEELRQQFKMKELPQPRGKKRPQAVESLPL